MKLFRLLALLALAPAAIADYHPPIEYGVARTVDFVLYNTDGTLDVDEADGGSEVTIDCDGTPATATNDFVDEGAFYSLALTAAETQCARITLTIAATDTNVVTIPTFGNASAMVVDYPADMVAISGDGTAADNLESYSDGTTPQPVNATQFSGDATAADNAELFYDGTGYNAANSTIGTVTTHTNERGTDNAFLAATAGSFPDLGSGATLGGNLEDMRDDGTAVFSRTTDSLQAIADSGGGGPTAAQIVDEWETQSQADPTGFQVNVIEVGGTAQTANDNGGDINTLVTRVGTPGDLGGGATLADNNADMAGGTFSAATDSQEAIRDRGDAAWTTGSGTGLTAIATGTAQGGSATTIQLASGESFGDDVLNGAIVKITGGTGDGQFALVTDYTGSTDTATVFTSYTSNQWLTNPDATSTYEIIPATVNVQAWNNSGVTTNVQTASDVVDEWETQSQADPTGFHVNVLEIGGTAQTANDNGADINGILVNTAEIGSAGAGLTEAGGTGDQFTAQPWNATWDAEVESEATDALNAYDPPTDAEMDAGFAALNDPTAAAIVAALLSESCAAPGAGTIEEQICSDIDDIFGDTNELQTDDVPGLIAALNDLDAVGVRTAVGLGSANLDGQLSTIDQNVDDIEAGVIVLRRGLTQNDTTIATLASQTSFTLTAGSADDNAYNGCGIMVTDQTTATQIAMAGIQDYTGSTRTVTLDDDPGIFTMAVGDLVTITCHAVSVEFMNKSEVLGTGASGDPWTGN